MRAGGTRRVLNDGHGYERTLPYRRSSSRGAEDSLRTGTPRSPRLTCRVRSGFVRRCCGEDGRGPDNWRVARHGFGARLWDPGCDRRPTPARRRWDGRTRGTWRSAGLGGDARARPRSHGAAPSRHGGSADRRRVRMSDGDERLRQSSRTWSPAVAAPPGAAGRAPSRRRDAGALTEYRRFSPHRTTALHRTTAPDLGTGPRPNLGRRRTGAVRLGVNPPRAGSRGPRNASVSR